MHGYLFGKNDSVNRNLPHVIHPGNYFPFSKKDFGWEEAPLGTGRRVWIQRSSVVSNHCYLMTLAKWLEENQSVLGARLLAHPQWSHWHFQALLIVFNLGPMGAVQLSVPLLGRPCQVLPAQGRSGGRRAAAASSPVNGTAFNPLAAYSGISSELSIFIQEHFRRKAPLCFAVYFPCQHPDLQRSPAGLPQKKFISADSLLSCAETSRHRPGDAAGCWGPLHAEPGFYEMRLAVPGAAGIPGLRVPG